MSGGGGKLTRNWRINRFDRPILSLARMRRSSTIHPMQSRRACRLIRPIVFTSLLGLGGGGWGKLASACSCREPPPPIEACKSSAAVFIGTVVSGRLEGDNGRRYEFKVEESLKGKLNSNVEVFTGRGGGDCGYNFEIGGKYLVYAGGSQEELGTSICTRTKPYDFAGYNSRGEEERGKTEAEELKAELHSDSDKKTPQQELESQCVSYHLGHHREDERAADAEGCVEFNGYKVSVGRITNGEAVVGIKVTSQKHVDPTCQCQSAERDADWQERWLSTTNGWVFAERLTKPAGLKIFR
jgi:hypothetical protein